jgi:hypothetical protein
MTGRPRPLEAGDQAHLTPASVRWSVARTMRLVASMAAEVGGDTRQYAALLAGVPVVMSRDDVRSFVPPDRRPANLDAWPLWLLRGDDRLTVYRRKRGA